MGGHNSVLSRESGGNVNNTNCSTVLFVNDTVKKINSTEGEKHLTVLLSISQSYHYDWSISALFDAISQKLSANKPKLAGITEVGIVLGSPGFLSKTISAKFSLVQEDALRIAQLYFCHWIFRHVDAIKIFQSQLKGQSLTLVHWQWHDFNIESLREFVNKLNGNQLLLIIDQVNTNVSEKKMMKSKKRSLKKLMNFQKFQQNSFSLLQLN